MDGGFNEYDQYISDHRPVALKLDFNTSLVGDVNDDGVLNVLDIVLLVDIVLNQDYQQAADLNQDGLINVVDVVLLVNLIISN